MELNGELNRIDNIKLNILSDFEDFYDSDSDAKSSESTGFEITYNRFRDQANKLQELNLLKSIGVPTINIVPVQSVAVADPRQKVIVYTDLSKHGGKGKVLVTFDEANLMYRNKMCSLLSSNYDGYTYKYVQIGKRRFWIKMLNVDLKASQVVQVQELSNQYNYLIKYPIFSIDYTFDNGKQVAVDFNSIQSLKNLSLDNLFSAVEIVKELKNYFINFNHQK